MVGHSQLNGMLMKLRDQPRGKVEILLIVSNYTAFNSASDTNLIQFSFEMC